MRQRSLFSFAVVDRRRAGDHKMTDTNDGSLTEKIALVTGAGKGIGRACAVSLARSGARVLAVARTLGDLETLAKGFGGRIQPWAADVRDDAFIEGIRRLEKLDILVNSAGTNRLQHILDVDDTTPRSFAHTERARGI
jgi:NADP-dependent 3-hydroxy acid dehydrogenase YdfG